MRENKELHSGSAEGAHGARIASAATTACNPATARVAVFFIAAALILTGLLQGQYQDVLVKAARICLECVGIG